MASTVEVDSTSSLHHARIETLPSTAYYIPNFITPDEEQAILDRVRRPPDERGIIGRLGGSHGNVIAGLTIHYIDKFGAQAKVEATHPSKIAGMAIRSCPEQAPRGASACLARNPYNPSLAVPVDVGQRP